MGKKVPQRGHGVKTHSTFLRLQYAKYRLNQEQIGSISRQNRVLTLFISGVYSDILQPYSSAKLIG
jgi:hypothetical protein